MSSYTSWRKKKSDYQRCSFNVQCSQQENQVTSCCHDPGIHRVHTPRSWCAYLMVRHQCITWHNVHSLCWANRWGKSFYLHVLQWSILHYPSPELSWIEKHQDANVNIRDFVIVKYEGTFYLGDFLHLVPNQSATVGTVKCNGLKFWKWTANQDVLDYSLHDIKRVIKPPTIVSNHGIFSVPELEYV